MKVVVLLLIAGLTGCGTHFDPERLEEALKYCDKNEGINYIHINTSSSDGKEIIVIKCNDGAAFYP